MFSNYACPTCSADDWLPIERFVFRRRDHEQGRCIRRSEVLLRKALGAARIVAAARPRSGRIQCDALDSYSRLRREILFKLWAPGRDELELASQHCRRCGFTTYTPRPSERDMEAQYAYLKEHEPDIGGQDMHSADEIAMDRIRAERVCRTVLEHVEPGAGLRVLDYGGGNGKLLMPLLERGHRCDLVDYSDMQLPGIRKIANDTAGMPPDARYEVIIVSHVLEHVVEPGALLEQLKGFLATDGILYAEVPQEIWAGIPIEADPLTHVNFFQECSLWRLFESRGFRILRSHREVSSYGVHFLEAVWVVAAKADGCQRVHAAPRRPANDTPELLRPGRLYSARRVWSIFLEPRLRKLLRAPPRSRRIAPAATGAEATQNTAPPR